MVRPMTALNYHHLFYFWCTVREGGIANACRKLRLAPPTVSAQIHALEHALGEKLLVRSGRGLKTTEAGDVAYRYASEIFQLGDELLNTLQERPTGKPLRLAIGITDVVPKTIVRRVLQAARRTAVPTRLMCVEGQHERLLVDLAARLIDVVIADAPRPAGSLVKAFSHLLGECGVGLFASPPLARRYRKGFPLSLNGAPVLLPTVTSDLRRALDDWFNSMDIKPVVEVEADDSALLKALGQDGMGIFPAPEVLRDDMLQHYNSEWVGPATDVRARYFAISVERRVKHPGVVAILEDARQNIFDRSVGV